MARFKYSSELHTSGHISLCPINTCQYFFHCPAVPRYAPGTNCSYLLRGSPTQKVRIHFEKMKMTQKTPITDVGSECSEYLALYDASWPDPSRVMKVFCSSFSPPLENKDFVSTGAALLVTFISRSGRLFQYFCPFFDCASSAAIPGQASITGQFTISMRRSQMESMWTAPSVTRGSALLCDSDPRGIPWCTRLERMWPVPISSLLLRTSSPD